MFAHPPCSRAPRHAVLRAAVALVVVVCGAVACDVRAEVTVDLRRDGGGTITARVELDEDAVSRLERISDDPLESGSVVPLADLVAAGWVTDGLVRIDGGGAELMLVHEFDAPGEVAPLVEHLAGDSGLITDVVVNRDHTTWSETDEVSLTVDLAGTSPGVVNDPELAASLAALGVNASAIDAVLAAELAESLSVSVTASAGDSSRTVTVEPGERATATATSERNRTDRVVLLGVAAALAALALAALVTLVVSLARSSSRGSGASRRRGSQTEDGVDLGQ